MRLFENKKINFVYRFFTEKSARCHGLLNEISQLGGLIEKSGDLISV